MTGTQGARTRYATESVATASPARLVTMLYDRLVRDLHAGEVAIGSGDRAGASQHLLHAQEILFALRSSLKPEAWDGGPALAALYDFVLGELVAANVGKDVTRIVSCRQLLEPLQEAWHLAEAGVAP